MIGVESVTALAAILNTTKLTHLECAAPKRLSMPVDTRLLLLPPPTPCSLDLNDIGVEGASALAAVLKESMITNLKCAAARVFA